ncbi:hypothetical protein HZH68_017130 [Vespula germanica]|uniref:Uncharacterized protein n=1 Tax=Vespula germanica TaxID=30212 RepID=A0A834IZR5_VESGE|nr:hypothetical protein HZH68_017130 [Vespula germanica]
MTKFPSSNWCKCKIVGAELYLQKFFTPVCCIDFVIFTAGNACRLEELRGKTAVEKRSKLIKQSYKPRYYLKKQDFWKDEREFI